MTLSRQRCSAGSSWGMPLMSLAMAMTTAIFRGISDSNSTWIWEEGASISAVSTLMCQFSAPLSAFPTRWPITARSLSVAASRLCASRCRSATSIRRRCASASTAW